MEPPPIPKKSELSLPSRSWRVAPLIAIGLILSVVLLYWLLTKDISPIDDSDLGLTVPSVEDTTNPFQKIREMSLTPDAEDKLNRIREMQVSATMQIDNAFIDSVLAEYAEELKTLDELATTSNWKIDYDLEYFTESHELGVLKILSQLQRIRIERDLADGNHSDAINRSLLMISFYQNLQNAQGGLLHFYFGAREIDRVNRLLAIAVQQGNCSEDQLRDLTANIERFSITDDFVQNALKVEYQVGSRLIAKVGRGEIDLKEFFDEETEISPKAQAILKLSFRENKTRLIFADAIRQGIEASEGPRSEDPGSLIFEFLEEQKKNQFSALFSGNATGLIIISTIFPPIDLLLDRDAVYRTDQRLLLLQIAMQRFHLKKQRWPESLNELTPEFIDSIPTDLMDGKPLRYNADTRTIYSVGVDFIDNGGETDSGKTDPLRDRNEPAIRLEESGRE